MREREERGEIEVLRKLASLAENELNCSMAQLALAWCLKNKNVSTILLGATNEDQLKENLGCIEVAKRLTDNHMETIDEILGNKPDPWVGPGGDGNRELKTI